MRTIGSNPIALLNKNQFNGNLDKQNRCVKFMWTRNESIWMLAALEAELKKLNAHCGLTGSVLYRGDSTKDLDVIIYPRHKNQKDHWIEDEIKSFLVKFFESEKMNDCSSKSQKRDDKKVCWLTTGSGKRIDFFFLS